MMRDIALAILVAVALTGLALMLWSWLRRSKRDAGIAVPIGEATGAEMLRAEGFHVATTRHDSPLDRIAAKPLGFRARAEIVVTDAGLGVIQPGELPVFIPATALVGAGHATWTIDRVVERDGLVLVAWRGGDTIFDTYLRLQSVSPASLIEAVEKLTANETPTGATR
ncbi:hypothetical protein [Microbacterium amylolyticum]|uniref:PH domain-containing protein n=1 Tax=Microbacterium amylolyticum TaxID=936337 RepID=A0ABS4ZGE6_9MICO|nr:hypothetical protein [Microbacterium amylolyticum]MBP2435541.1 hypothetical protein [Microbacterium amylolyticum]